MFTAVPFWELVSIGLAVLTLLFIIWAIVWVIGRIIRAGREAFVSDTQSPHIQPVYMPPASSGYAGNGYQQVKD